MRKYCKAYLLREMRQFSGWTEQSEAGAEELTDDSVCYLWDDLTVVRSPILETGVIFDNITPAWQDFCQHTLKFEIPEDLKFAYESAGDTVEAVSK